MTGGPHAARLRPALDRRAVAPPPARRPEGSRCHRVFTDQASATKADRPGLAEALSHLRCGDVQVLWKLERLGRTVKGLVDFVADLQGRGAQFRSLIDGSDTTPPAGRFFFPVMASLAQTERELLADRADSCRPVP